MMHEASGVPLLEEGTGQFVVAVGGKKGKENSSAAPISAVGLVRGLDSVRISSVVACLVGEVPIEFQSRTGVTVTCALNVA